MDSWPELRNQSLAKVVVLRKLAILHKIRLKTPLQNLHKTHTKWYLSKQRIFIHSFDPNHILHNQRNRDYMKQNHSKLTDEHLWPSGCICKHGEALRRGRYPVRVMVPAEYQIVHFVYLIPTIYVAISVIETILENHSRKLEELPQPSGYTWRSARQGSIPSHGRGLSQILDYTFLSSNILF